MDRHLVDHDLVKSRVFGAKSCGNSEPTSASPSRPRKRTIEGMNQVRSNGRLAPTSRLRVSAGGAAGA